MTPPAPESDDLFRVWKALADPSRRGMLDLLRERPMTTGELAERFAFSRFAVMKHLDVLERVNLVLVRRAGRERWNHLNPVPLQQIYARWLRPFEAPRVRALHRLKALAETPGEAMSATTPLGSYRVELEIPIEAKRERVWQALTEETARWWPEHFFSSPDAKHFVMENRVGGSVYEDWGNGAGAEWGRVVVYQPPERLVWAGNHFSPGGQDWGRYFLNILLREEKGKTVLTLQDSAFGLLSESTGKGTESGWRELFGEHFKKYAETAKPAKGKKKA